MIYKNHEHVNNVWDELLKEYTGNIFIIEVSSHYQEIFRTIEENQSLLESVDKVIVVSTSEAFFSSIWFEIVRKLKSCGIKEPNILIEDRGGPINPHARKWFNVSNPFTWPCDPNVTNDPPLNINKNRILLSLARYPRPFRVILTNELLLQNIVPSDKFLMTCGSASEDWNHFYDILPDSSKSFFPIDMFGRVSQDTFYNEGKTHEPVWASAMINLVMESGYTPTQVIVPGDISRYITLSDSWDRYFFTEKTEKAIRYRQIPIFAAPAGYVEYIRSLGYDVFDDFINHSYDYELDPFVRIKLIAKEVGRVCNLLLNTNVTDYSVCVNNFHERTERNIKNLQKVREKVIKTRTEEVKRFLRL